MVFVKLFSGITCNCISRFLSLKLSHFEAE
jgi:hypothetical protein